MYEYLNIKKALAVKNVLHPIFPRSNHTVLTDCAL